MLVDSLRNALGPERVSDRPIDLARLAHDASHYLVRPQAVVVAQLHREAAGQGLQFGVVAAALDLERDEKSGGYVVRLRGADA